MAQNLKKLAELKKLSPALIQKAFEVTKEEEAEYAKLPTDIEFEKALYNGLPASKPTVTARNTTSAPSATTPVNTPTRPAAPARAQITASAAPAAAQVTARPLFTPPQLDFGGMNFGPVVYVLVLVILLAIGWSVLSYAAPNLPGWLSQAATNFGKGSLGKVTVLGLRQPNGLRAFGDAQIVLLMVTVLYVLGRVFEALLRGQVITDGLGIFAAAAIATIAFAGESMSVQLNVGQFRFQSAEAGPVLIVCLLWTLFWVYRGEFDLTPLTGLLGDSVFIALTVGSLGAFSKLLGLSAWGYTLPFMQSVEAIRAGNTASGLFSIEVLGLVFAAVFVQSMELFSRRDINSMLAAWASVGFYFFCRWGFSLNMFVSIGLTAVFLIVALMYVATLRPVAKEGAMMGAAQWRDPIYRFNKRLYIPDPSDLIIYVALLWVLVVLLTGTA